MGYCQGINFIVLQLLNVLKNEEDVFWVLVSIMDIKDWKRYFANGTPKLLEEIKKLESTMKKSLPRLYNHFKEIEVSFINN